MGLFDAFKGKKGNNQSEDSNQSSQAYIEDSYNDVSDDEAAEINLTTSSGVEVPNTKSGLSLKKSVITLDKSLSSISLKKGIDMNSHTARVAIALDYSGSMDSNYSSGLVQETLTRLMPIALMFDDNCELDVWLFHNHYYRVQSMTLNNFDNYVKTCIIDAGYTMGGTHYSPVIDDMMRYYFEEERSSNIPTFVIFLTDGDNGDRTETDQAVIKSSHENMFIQFLGIGRANFIYLEKLDNLQGRPVDNTGFIKVTDLKQMNNEQLYNKLLDQYPEWLKAKGLK